MVYFYPILQRCDIIVSLFAESAADFFEWLFTVGDWGILGEIAPIQLISLTLVMSFLIARILLAINK